MSYSIEILVGLLSPACRAALEKASQICADRQHGEVLPAHLICALSDSGANNDFLVLLAHYGVDSGEWRDVSYNAIREIGVASTDRIVFSPAILKWLEVSWMVSSLKLGFHCIRSSSLLLSLIDARFSFACLATMRLLSGLSASRIMDELSELRTILPEDSVDSIVGAVPQSTYAVGGNDTESGPGPLQLFCVDLTASAKSGDLDPVFGRERELQKMLDIIGRRRKNNPILLGEPGVGKTALAEALALKIKDGQMPPDLRDAQLLALDVGLLQAGAGVKGVLEKRVSSLIGAIKRSESPVLLFIDEVHSLLSAEGVGDLLKPALARGELRAIAATTWKEYKKYFEKDAALARRFQQVTVEPFDVSQTVTVLRGLRNRYESSHKVHIADEACRAAAELADRYLFTSHLPDKAVDVLDTASARVKFGRFTPPLELIALRADISALEMHIEARSRDLPISELASSGGVRTGNDEVSDQLLMDRLQALRAREQDLENEWSDGDNSNLNASDDETLNPDCPALPCVSAKTVATVISDWTGIPLGYFERDQTTAITEFPERIGKRICGQDDAVMEVFECLKSSLLGLSGENSPLGVFLLVGPSGVGKTETVLAVAETLFGGEEAAVVINMSEFREGHSVSRLIGAPPGYVGFGEGGVLTEAVRKRPYCVVLLDEVEKAHRDVLNLFYQVFDKGILSDSDGRMVDFSNTVIFLTSNLASSTIERLSPDSSISFMDLTKSIGDELSDYFKPALLGRMHIVPYRSLDPSALKEIADMKLGQLKQQVHQRYGISLDCDDTAFNAIVDLCDESPSGARLVNEVLRKRVMPLVADLVLSAKVNDLWPEQMTLSFGVNERFVLVDTKNLKS